MQTIASLKISVTFSYNSAHFKCPKARLLVSIRHLYLMSLRRVLWQRLHQRCNKSSRTLGRRMEGKNKLFVLIVLPKMSFITLVPKWGDGEKLENSAPYTLTFRTNKNIFLASLLWRNSGSYLNRNRRNCSR